MNLVTETGIVPLSIKQADAQYWESADTLWGKEADLLVTHLAETNKIDLIKIGGTRADGAPIVHITPEVSVRATEEQAKNVVFGSDILEQNGAVIKQTFCADDFFIHDNCPNLLCIMVDEIITSLDDLSESMEVHFLIRNDKSRARPAYKYPGIRVFACYAERLTKYTHQVEPELLNEIVQKKSNSSPF